MQRNVKLAIAGTLVACALAFATSVASALRSISIRGSEGGISLSGRLLIESSRLDLLRLIACEVTLLGTIARAVQKRAGAIFGKITGMAIRYGNNECSLAMVYERIDQVIALKQSSGTLAMNSSCGEIGGNVFLCNTTGGRPELWNLVYDSFAGSLPAFTSMEIRIANSQIKTQATERFGFRYGCLFAGDVQLHVPIGRGGTILEPQIVLSGAQLAVINTLEGSCLAGPYNFNGTFRVSPTLTTSLT